MTTVMPIVDGDTAHVALQGAARDRIERRERLVEQQDFRLHRQRTGQRNTLLLAARQILHVASGIIFKFHQPKQFGDALSISASRPPGELQSEPDALLRRSSTDRDAAAGT